MCGLRKPPQIWPQSRATHPKGPDFPPSWPTQQRPCADFWRARKRAPKSPERQNLAQLHVTPTSTHHTEVAVTNPRPSCTTRIREHQCDTIGWLSARAHATQYARHHHQCFRKKKNRDPSCRSRTTIYCLRFQAPPPVPCKENPGCVPTVPLIRRFCDCGRGSEPIISKIYSCS